MEHFHKFIVFAWVLWAFYGIRYKNYYDSHGKKRAAITSRVTLDLWLIDSKLYQSSYQARFICEMLHSFLLVAGQCQTFCQSL